MKFNEIVNQFQHNVFGDLTTIRSYQDKNKIWFLAPEVGNKLGYKNITDTLIKIKVRSNEKFVLTSKKHPQFWKEFATSYQLGAKIRSITLISESALYRLVMRSNKDEAIKFQEWIASDVLPKLRQGIEEDLIIREASVVVLKHLNEEHQKEESKAINHKNMIEGGVNKTVNYNVKNCIDHDELGRTPKEVKEWGEEIGLSSKDRTSAKAVFRVTNKPVASAMSFHDSLVRGGLDYNKALILSNGAGKILFTQMLNLGVEPKELKY